MTGIPSAANSSPRQGEFQPLLDTSEDPPREEGATAFQRELAGALADDDGRSTHINDRPESPGGVFWDLAMGVFGIASLLAGVVLVFFFAAAGSIVLLLGGLLCTMAFTGARSRGQLPARSGNP